MPVKSFRLLGIDPGFGRCGYGVTDRQGGDSFCVTYGCLETSKTLAHEQRLLAIQVGIRGLVREHKPKAVVIEKLTFKKNVTTAIKVAEARGVVLVVAAEAKLPVIEVTPNQVKQALTSYGNADKQQVQRMVQMVLQLDELPKPDDAADALAVALAGEQMYETFSQTRLMKRTR